MNFKRIKNQAHILAGSLVCVAMASTVLFIGTEDADAATSSQPYGGCKEAYQAPTSKGAADCRDKGWTVRPGFVVSPRGVLRYYDLPSCRLEDGSGQYHACGWNVTEGDGNGRGLAYIAITMTYGNDAGDDRFISLNKCNDGECIPWKR